MELAVFLSLIGIGSIFILTAAISKDRINLFPAGFIFLFTALFLIAGNGLQIQSGTSYDYQEINNETLTVNETANYETVEFPVENVNFSESLAIVLIAISLYFFVIAGAKINLRTSIFR